MLRKTVETSVLDLVKTVDTSLVDMVKKELQSYSSAVQKTPQNEQVFSSEALTRVVRNVVEEEDCSRNVVIFGLNEEDDEKLNERVAEVFESIGQKPRAETCRVICFKAVHFVGALLDDIETLKNFSSSLQNKVIESQQDVICIQAELQIAGQNS